MNKGRFEAFSDGVIAILITIMVLELHTPQGTSWDALGRSSGEVETRGGRTLQARWGCSVSTRQHYEAKARGSRKMVSCPSALSVTKRLSSEINRRASTASACWTTAGLPPDPEV